MNKIEHVREYIKEYAEKNLVFGKGYYLDLTALEGELERYVLANAYIAELGNISVLKEFSEIYQDIEGVGFKEMEGMTIYHFIDSCLVFGENEKISSADLRRVYDEYFKNGVRYKLNYNQLFIKLWKIGKHEKHVIVERAIISMSESGKSKRVRGLVGVGLRSTSPHA